MNKYGQEGNVSEGFFFFPTLFFTVRKYVLVLGCAYSEEAVCTSSCPPRDAVLSSHSPKLALLDGSMIGLFVQFN